MGVEVWRGGVNAWDCDSMGHLNVRFYVAYAMEGLAGLAAELGLPGAFAPGAPSTVIVRDHHIRYLREAHAQTPLHMRAGVLEIGESEAVILQVLYHSANGQPCAALQTRIAHVTGRDLRPFPWSAKARSCAETLTVELPDFAKARSLSQSPLSGAVGLAQADRLGLQPIGLGLVNPADCDPFGRLMAHHFIGHVADGIHGIVHPFRAAVVEFSEGDKPERVGGAALEYRVAYAAWPRAGDRLVVRTGLSGIDHRTLKMTHWLLDPDSQRVWGGLEAVVTTFDLDRRKIVPISAAAQKQISGWLTPGLSL